VHLTFDATETGRRLSPTRSRRKPSNAAIRALPSHRGPAPATSRDRLGR
jgi:hypothetical protein